MLESDSSVALAPILRERALGGTHLAALVGPHAPRTHLAPRRFGWREGPRVQEPLPQQRT